MSQTQKLGKPAEFFKKNPPNHWGINKEDADNLELRCKLAASEGISSNGVCGIKLFAYHFARVQDDISIFEWFPNISLVSIHRRDLLGQAISFAIAKQTRRFHKRDEDRGVVPKYSAEQIYECLEWFTLEEARWREYFARTGMPVHQLWYEDLVKQPRESIRLLSEAVGVPVDLNLIDLEKSGVFIQRSGINGEWRERFMADCGDSSRVKRKWLLTDGKMRPKRKITRLLRRVFRGSSLRRGDTRR